MNKRFYLAALFLAVLAFFLLTVPANHSEAEDAYFYARMVEQGGRSALFHAHHLLYLPLMRILFSVISLCGCASRALPILIGFSMVSGAAAVCLLVLLSGRKLTNLFFAASLLFSYGFWRYSTTAEIYIPVTALSLLALDCARRSAERPLFFWLSALAASAALLMHVISWPLVLVALPFFYLATQRPSRAVCHLGLVLTVTAVLYAAVISGPGLSVFSDGQALRETLGSPQTWAKGVVAWSQNIGSGNFFFANQSVAEKLQELFPYHMLQEELYMGQMAPSWAGRIAPFTFAGVVAAMGALLVMVLLNVRRAFSVSSAWPVTILLWLGGTAATALFFEPANPEMWICTLAPFWLLLSVLFDRSPEVASPRRWVPGGLAVVLLIHNAVGGMSLVKSPRGDYGRQKTEWIVAEAHAGDAILMADSHAAVTFLQYQTPAQVIDAKFIDPQSWQDLREQAAGRIFVFSDVLDPLPAVSRRGPEAVENLRLVAELLRPALKWVHSDEFGTIYDWEEKGAVDSGE